MKIDTKALVSMTEANQNFSKVARLVDETGAVIILKNNLPRYLIVDFQQAEEDRPAEEDELQQISQRLIQKNRQAYEELAK